MCVRTPLLLSLFLMVFLIAEPVLTRAEDSRDADAFSGQPSDESKPNIVLVLMDNFGYGEPGIYGGGAIRGAATPHIDSIAHEGFQLTNYNVDSECTPSRAALMSGRYSMRTRLRQDGTIRSEWYGLTEWEYTLPEMLSDAGYATGIFGKWHLGDTEGRLPTDQGFDEWWGIPHSSNEAYWPDSNSFPDDLDVHFQHIMTSTRGERPRELEVYDRGRALIERSSSSAVRREKESRFSLTCPTPKRIHPTTPIPPPKEERATETSRTSWLRPMSMWAIYSTRSMSWA